MRSARGAIGGAANEAGSEYRRAVGAALLVSGLCGGPPPFLDLDAHEAPLRLHLEVAAPIDDLVVDLEGGRRLWLQATTSLQLSERPDSKLARFLSQCGEMIEDARFGDADLIAVVADRCSQPVMKLAAALARLRAAGFDSDVLEPELGAVKKRLLEASDPQRFLDSVRIVHFPALGSDSEEARIARATLEANLLPGLGSLAWDVLKNLVGERASRREAIEVSDAVVVLERHRLDFSRGALGSSASRQVRSSEAVRRYRTSLQEESTWIDIRHLGVPKGKIDFQPRANDFTVSVPPETDRGVEETEISPFVTSIPSGRESYGRFIVREPTMPLGAALHNRNRALLIGEPGAGKSTALRQYAADLTSHDGWPLPLTVRVPDLRSKLKDGSALEVAVHAALATTDVQIRSDLIAAALERAVEGQLSIMVDGLDEARDQIPAVLAWIERLANEAPECQIVVATRPTAEGAAETLGYDQVELLPYLDLGPTLRVVLDAFIPRDDARWSSSARRLQDLLNREPRLTITPLVPILLAITVGRGFTRLEDLDRAQLLSRVVDDLVDAWEVEGRRRGDVHLGSVRGTEAKQALRDSFGVIGDRIRSEPPISARELATYLSAFLREGFGLSAGSARSSAADAVRFWDELGMFFESGELLRARGEFLIEVAEAEYAVRFDPKPLEWFRGRVERGGSPDMLALALSRSPGLFEDVLGAIPDLGPKAVDAIGAAIDNGFSLDHELRGSTIATLTDYAVSGGDVGVAWACCLVLVMLVDPGDWPDCRKRLEQGVPTRELGILDGLVRWADPRPPNDGDIDALQALLSARYEVRWAAECEPLEHLERRDMPNILITADRDGAEVAVEPALFHLAAMAGERLKDADDDQWDCFTAAISSAEWIMPPPALATMHANRARAAWKAAGGGFNPVVWNRFAHDYWILPTLPVLNKEFEAELHDPLNEAGDRLRRGLLLELCQQADRSFSAPLGRYAELQRAHRAARELGLDVATPKDLLGVEDGDKGVDAFRIVFSGMTYTISALGLVSSSFDGIDFKDGRFEPMDVYVDGIIRDGALGQASPQDPLHSDALASAAEFLGEHRELHPMLAYLAIHVRRLLDRGPGDLASSWVTEALAGMSPELRFRAARDWLAISANPGSVAADWAKSDKGELRFAAAEGAGALWGDPTKRNALTLLLRDEHPWIRAKAIQAVPDGPLAEEDRELLRAAAEIPCEHRLNCTCTGLDIRIGVGTGRCVECGRGIDPFELTAAVLDR
jgi:hypothetical protein